MFTGVSLDNFCFIMIILSPSPPFVTFNLFEGIDVFAIEAKIAKYQEENAEQVRASRTRKVLLRVASSFIGLVL